MVVIAAQKFFQIGIVLFFFGNGVFIRVRAFVENIRRENQVAVVRTKVSFEQRACHFFLRRQVKVFQLQHFGGEFPVRVRAVVYFVEIRIHKGQVPQIIIYGELLRGRNSRCRHGENQRPNDNCHYRADDNRNPVVREHVSKSFFGNFCVHQLLLIPSIRLHKRLICRKIGVAGMRLRVYNDCINV